MAAGDQVTFEQANVDRDNGVHNFSTDVFKAALVDSTLTPTAADPGPHFGGTGSTDYQPNEVSGGTEYVAGGKTIASLAASLLAGKSNVDAPNFSWALDGSGPTDSRYMIIYNDSDANKRAWAFVDLGQILSLQAAPIEIQVNELGFWETEAVASA